MCGGLPATPGPAEEALFEGLAEQDRRVLANGFGDKVGEECWTRWEEGRVAGELRARGRDDLDLGLALLRREV